MKTTISLISASLILAASARAEVPAVEASAARAKTAAQAATQEQQKLPAEDADQAQPAKKRVSYGGALVEISRAEKKARVFSLRQPRDPKQDYKHVYYEERSSRPKGLVLFSLNF